MRVDQLKVSLAIRPRLPPTHTANYRASYYLIRCMSVPGLFSHALSLDLPAI